MPEEAGNVGGSGPENEDILGEYLSGDPSILSPAELQSIATAFDMPIKDLKAIVEGMSRVRAEVRTEYGDHN